MPEAAPPSIPARRRASDLLALALVAASVGLVSASLAPSLARELGWTRASLSRRADPRPPSHGLPGLDPSPHGRPPGGPGFGLLDPGLPDLVAPPEDLSGDEDDPTPDARLAVTVRDVVVRDGADERAASRGRVVAGELLIVIREAGAWAMVAHLSEEGSTTGWVRRGDLAIR